MRCELRFLTLLPHTQAWSDTNMAGESLEAEAEQSGDVVACDEELSDVSQSRHSQSDVSQSRARKCRPRQGGGDGIGKKGAKREEEVGDEGQEEEEEGGSGEGGGM